MSSIVRELQADATNPSQSVTTLLRKAKIVAVKLELPEFLDWIDQELNGYEDAGRIPPYRELRGEPRGWNPYHGWIPVIIQEPEMVKKLSAIPNGQPIAELEDVFGRGSGHLHIPYHPEAQSALSRAVGFTTKYAMMVNRSEVARIFDAIRNIILDWSLKLEKEDILGEDLSFSDEEKIKANEQNVKIQIGRIGKFIGSLGAMSGHAHVSISGIDPHKVEQIQNLVEQIKKYIDDIELSEDDKTEVNDAIKQLDTELGKEEPEPGMVNKLLGSIGRVAEGVSGNVIAQGILANIDKLIQFL